MYKFIHSILIFIGLSLVLLDANAQTVSININNVSVGMYSGSGSDCGDCISSPDVYIDVRFKHSGTGTWGGGGSSRRDNVGCDNYGGVGGYSTSSIAWSGATIQIQIDSWEDDGGVCGGADGDCAGGYGDPNNGTNNLTIVAQPSCGTNNGVYYSERINCSSDGSTNDYRARWYYQWWWDAGSISASTTAGVIGGSATVCSGANITVTNTTNGSLYPRGSVVFQQRFNSGAWSDVGSTTTNTASSASTVSQTYSATLSTAGTYEYRRVVRYCTNSSGGTTQYESNIVTIVVVPDPSFTTSPTSSTPVCTGGTIPNLTVSSANGTPSRTHQWYSNTSNSYTGATSISGETGTSYAPPTGTAGNMYYFCTVSSAGSGCTSTNSSIAQVQVVSQPSASAPASPTICLGGSANITSNRSGGTGLFDINWQYSADGSTGWANVVNGTPAGISYSNANTSTMTVIGDGSEALGAKYYRMVATSVDPNINCAAISTNSVVTTIADPTLSIPSSPTVCVGGSANITSTVSGGTGPMSRQWQYSSDGMSWASVTNGTPSGISYAGGTGGTLTVTGDGSETSGTWYYRLRYYPTSGTSGCETYSSASTYTVVPEPTLSAPAALTTVCSGGSASLTSTASGGSGSFTYRWQYSADGSTGWANVVNGTPAGITYVGGTGTTLTVSGNGTEANISKYYRLVLSSTTISVGCDAISSTAEISTVADPIINLPTPTSQTVCQNGAPTDLSTSASGGTASAYTYNWYRNGSNSTSGGTLVGSGINYTAVTSAIGTLYYYSIVTQPESGCAATTASTASVTVVTLPSSGTLSKTPNVTTVCEGQTVSATATAGSGGTGTITDYLEYRTDAGSGYSAWASYTAGTPIATTGLVSVEIQTYRTATGSGCTSSTPTVASWTVVPQPQPGTLAKTPNVTDVCDGDNVSAVFTAGTGGTGVVTDILQYRYNGTGGWSNYTSGTNLSTTGRTMVEIRTYRTSTGTGCNTSSINTVTWNVSTLPSATPIIDYISTCDQTASISATAISSGASVSWSRVSGSGTPTSSTDNPLAVSSLTQGATSVYELFVSNAGCSNISAGTLSLVLPVNNASNIASSNSCAYCVITDGNTRNYFNSSGEIIATIHDDGLTTPAQLSFTEVCVGIDGSVQTVTDNIGEQQPYLQRKWTISPASNTNAFITLYFTASELAALTSTATSPASGWNLLVGPGTTFEDLTAAQVRAGYQTAGTDSYIPLRIAQAGVMPIIFAGSILQLPQILSMFFLKSANPTLLSLGGKFKSFTSDNLWYMIVYFVLIFFFTYFYTAVTFDAEAMANNLQKNGAFVPNVRPGAPTADYVATILARTTFFGAVFFSIIAVMPFILQRMTGNALFAIGGTAILIAVSVCTDLIKKLSAQASMKEY